MFGLSVLDAAGEVSFTGHYDVTLAAVPDGTRLRLALRITETTVEAAPDIAGSKPVSLRVSCALTVMAGDIDDVDGCGL